MVFKGSMYITDFNTDLQLAKQFDAKSWPHERSFDGKINEWFWSFFGEFF